MQPLALSTTTPISLGTSSITADSRGSQVLARSSALGELGFAGGPGLQSVALQLPELKSIGDKATVFADIPDSNGNTLQIAFTFEKVGDNVIRASAAFPGTGGAFFSTFDIFLGNGGVIRGFDTNLDGRIDAITPPTLKVSANAFDVLPLRLKLNILSIGGDGGVRGKEAVSFLTPSLSLNTLLTAQAGADTSSF